MKVITHRLNDYIDRDRHPERPSFHMHFQERDTLLLETIYAFDGLLADYQIWQMLFPGTTDIRATQSRLAKLFHNSWLERTNLAGRKQFGCMVYWLSKRAIEHLAGLYGVGARDLHAVTEPGWSKVPHRLVTNAVRIAVVQACQMYPDLELEDWRGERVCLREADKVSFHSLTGKRLVRRLELDSFFVVVRKSTDFHSRLLLETDMATHPNERFVREKVLAGTAYLKSDAYATRYGERRGRWLVVTTSERRLSYLKENAEKGAAENAGVWHFTTQELITAESVLTKPIWWKGGSDEQVALFPERG